MIISNYLNQLNLIFNLLLDMNGYLTSGLLLVSKIKTEETKFYKEIFIYEESFISITDKCMA